MKKKSRDPEATRAAILDAAEKVFLKKGYGNSALSEIARQGGVTKSLIHHHFGSKHDLWREVKMRRFTHYMEQQLEMLQGGEPSVDLLRDSIKAYFNFLKENQEVVRILAWMYLEQDEHDLDLDKQIIEAGLQMLKASQEAGAIRQDVHPSFILFILIGLAQHWFQDCPHFKQGFGPIAERDDLDELYFKDMLKIFLEGVLPRGSKEEGA